MPWSPQQEEAIYSKGKNLLVAAAAGSGKTSVLVERIIQHLVSGYCNVDEILVVTFTRAAATEMEGRIAKAISEKLDVQKREEQLVRLNGASISTLHSFCQNILRQYFYQLDLDPKFRLANEQEINLLKRDVLDALFEKYYQGMMPEVNYFNTLVELYGSERGDDDLYKLILRLFSFAQAQPFPEQWLQALPNAYLVTDVTKTLWFKIFKEELAQDIKVCMENLKGCYQEAEALTSDKYKDLIVEELALTDELLAYLYNDWSSFIALAKDIKLKRFTKDKLVDNEASEKFKEKRNDAWAIIKEWKNNYALQSVEEMAADLPILYNQSKSLVEVTLAFAHDFAQGKRERNIIDFGDLEHFALAILCEDGSTADDLRPSPIALSLQSKFKEIMVDEYQDTNGVQEAILNLVAGHDPKRFYVGDVKQSIYKFRLAEPELFLAKYWSYPEEEDAKRIDLAQNFRSRGEVLKGVNSIFAQIMDQEIMELSYGEDEALKCGLVYPETGNTLAGPVELHLFGEETPYCRVNEEGTKEYVGYDGEINFIVDKIKALYGAGTMVYDKDQRDYRPIQWRDIVILLRSVVGKANDLAEAMRKAGIPVYASEDSGYFQAVEVDLILSLLQIIDNPQQDIPLTAVLFSVIGKFSKDELAEIKIAGKGLNMYQALELYVTEELKGWEKVAEFLKNLKAWRVYSQFHSVPQLLWKLYEDTGYYEYLGGLPEGTVRQANLRDLFTRAKDYENTSYRGLFRFLRYINRLQDLGNDLAVARTLGEGEDVVRIMTIHKSKGLEFPVVFMPNLNKQFNLQDAKEKILLHKSLGIGMYLQGENVAYENLAHQAMVLAINREAKAEEGRVLYVGMTRAREKLILSGSKIKEKNYHKIVNNAYSSPALLLNKELISKSNSFLDWILPSVARHVTGRGLAEVLKVEHAPCYEVVDEAQWQYFWGGNGEESLGEKADTPEDLWQKIRKLQPLTAVEPLPWLKDRLAWSYGAIEQAKIPAKLTVTEIKQRFSYNEELQEVEGFRLEEFSRPKFLKQSTALTGMEYGTLVHRILQCLDLKGDLSPKGIGEQIVAMQNRGLLPKELGGFVPYVKLAKFFSSPLGRRLLASPKVEREMNFNKLLPANMFYQVPQGAPDIFLQGVIDLLFAEDDGWVLVDYKTDNLGAEEAVERYALQLQLYSGVASDILQQPIKGAYLYMISTGEYYEVDLIKDWGQGEKSLQQLTDNLRG